MIPPILVVAGLKLVERLFNSPSRGGSSAPPDFTFYSVPEHELEAFGRAHPDRMHYTTFAEKLADAGFHESASAVTKRGRELMRKYDGQRIIVCADFRAG